MTLLGYCFARPTAVVTARTIAMVARTWKIKRHKCYWGQIYVNNSFNTASLSISENDTCDFLTWTVASRTDCVMIVELSTPLPDLIPQMTTHWPEQIKRTKHGVHVCTYKCYLTQILK